MDENGMNANNTPASEDIPAMESAQAKETVTENTYSQEATNSYAEPAPQYDYQEPTNGETPESGGNLGFSIASMVCGIISILCCCAWYLSIILAAVAIVFGILSLKKNAEGRNMAIAGLITGGIGAVLSIIILVFALVGSASVDSGELYREIIDSLGQ